MCKYAHNLQTCIHFPGDKELREHVKYNNLNRKSKRFKNPQKVDNDFFKKES